jgi:hypothetical protein
LDKNLIEGDNLEDLGADRRWIMKEIGCEGLG